MPELETLEDNFDTFGNFGIDALEGLGGFVYIERDSEVTKTSGGIEIPELSRDMVATGTVVMMGEGQKDKYGNTIPVDYKVGDHVAFHKFGGYETTLPDGKMYWMLEQHEIIGKTDANNS